MSTNLPLPDQLAEVREQIRQLKARETEITTLLIAEPKSRVGASYYAEVKTVTQHRVNTTNLRKHYPEIAEEFTRIIEYTTVTPVGITEDGELIPARAFKKLIEENTNGQ